MTALSDPIVESPSTPPNRRVEPVACVDLDRYCEGCGYNLRTLPVVRDENMGIPVVQCTECGGYQPANDASTALRPWLNRATSVLLVAWILGIVAVFIFAGIGEGAISYATLDELTVHGGYERQQVGNTTTITWLRGLGPLEVQADFPFHKSFIAAVLACSLAIAFACGMFAVVVLPHWPRAAYAALVLTIPLVAGALVAIGWSQNAPHLFNWTLTYLVAHVGVQLAGGVVGIAGGRPLARLAVRIFLPPGVRPRLAYLWLVDEKPFPRP
jgi:hypothetical protein